MSNGLIEKLEKALAAHKKAGELLEDALAAAKQEPTTGNVAKDLVSRFVVLWGQRYKGQTYLPAWAKDIVQMRRVLKAATPEQIEAKMRAYLADQDSFVSNARHPLGLFVAGFNRYHVAPAGGRMAEPEDDGFFGAAPADCRHTPRCATDVEHTKKLRGDR